MKIMQQHYDSTICCKVKGKIEKSGFFVCDDMFIIVEINEYRLKILLLQMVTEEKTSNFQCEVCRKSEIYHT